MGKRTDRLMRTWLMLIILPTYGLSFSQDTSVTWIRNIDTSSFEMLYNKKDIPKEFYRVLNIDNIRKLANPKDNYSPGCTNPVRGQLQWIARQNNRWVISITYGGRGVYTRFFFFDKENGTLNMNELDFPCPKRRGTTFGEIVADINSGQFSFEEYDPDNYSSED